jgi:single-strand DNA-binding protein
MARLNNVLLLGNLTRDPEVRHTPSGTPVATLGLAVNNRVRQGGEWKDDPCFIDVVVFGKQAESCGEYLSKGQPVLVEGRLRYRSWEGQDGQKRSKHEVSAFRVEFMPRGGQAPGGGAFSGEVGESEPTGDDDVPFVRSDDVTDRLINRTVNRHLR